jgi:hypothetical protein
MCTINEALDPKVVEAGELVEEFVDGLIVRLEAAESQLAKNSNPKGVEE